MNISRISAGLNLLNTRIPVGVMTTWGSIVQHISTAKYVYIYTYGKLLDQYVSKYHIFIWIGVFIHDNPDSQLFWFENLRNLRFSLLSPAFCHLGLWHRQLPTEIDEKSYTVLDTSEGLVMLHVNHGAKEAASRETISGGIFEESCVFFEVRQRELRWIETIETG